MAALLKYAAICGGIVLISAVIVLSVCLSVANDKLKISQNETTFLRDEVVRVKSQAEQDAKAMSEEFERYQKRVEESHVKEIESIKYIEDSEDAQCWLDGRVPDSVRVCLDRWR